MEIKEIRKILIDELNFSLKPLEGHICLVSEDELYNLYVEKPSSLNFTITIISTKYKYKYDYEICNNFSSFLETFSTSIFNKKDDIISIVKTRINMIEQKINFFKKRYRGVYFTISTNLISNF